MCIRDSYARAVEKGLLSTAQGEIRGSVEVPKDSRNGDYTSNFALAGAKALGMRPRDLAQILCDNLDLSGSYFEKAEIAGPGFLNFTVSSRWYGDVLAAVEAEGRDYGSSEALAGQKIMVEFVSANPTGPMPVSYTHLDVYKRQGYSCFLPMRAAAATAAMHVRYEKD